MMDDEKPRRNPIVDGGTGTFDVTDPVGGEVETANSGGPVGETNGATPGVDRESLVEVVRREPLLRALRSAPATPGDLTESVDLSRSTVHRALNSLEEHDLVERFDGEYYLTILGEVVAEEAAEFATQARAAMALEPFLNTIDMNGIPVEHFVDARITRRKPRQPHASLQRIIDLVEESGSLRMLSTVISPIYVDLGYREMTEGMNIEAVFDRQAIEIMLTQYGDKAYETVTTGRFDLYAHDGLPFELFIFDEKMGMAAHDENGIAQVLVESEAEPAIDWAEDLYARHLAEADPLTLR